MCGGSCHVLYYIALLLTPLTAIPSIKFMQSYNLNGWTMMIIAGSNSLEFFNPLSRILF